MTTTAIPLDDTPVYMGLPHERRLRPRLYAGIVLTLLVMLLAMGPMMGVPGLPPAEISARIQALLTAPVFFWCGSFFIKRWWRSLVKRDPNMFSLTVTGTGAAFGYSLWQTFGNGHVHHGNLYYEAAAFTTTAVLLGQILEQRAHRATEEAVRRLADLSPKTACVLRADGAEEVVAISSLSVGDLIRVRPGETVAADGVVVSGAGALDESMLTGESLPVEKAAGERVKAGTANRNGSLVVRISATGEETALAHLIRLVESAQDSEPPIARVADRVLTFFVPAVLAVSLITFFAWWLAGAGPGAALGRAVAVLVIACPCTLGLATPVAIVAGIGRGAKSGILVRDAAALEALAQVREIGVDKTGTLTRGKPAVEAVTPSFGYNEAELLALAGAVEIHSEHPLAKAIVERMPPDSAPCTDFRNTPGLGVAGVVGARLVEVRRALSPPAGHPAATAAEVVVDGNVAGVIFLSDTLKPEATEAVSELQALGLRVVLVSGDREGAVAQVAAQVGADDHVSAQTPEGKLHWLRGRRGQGIPIAFVGDGINDAPALVAADAGIAIGQGSDIAKFSAGIVVLSPRPSALPAAVRLSRAVMKTIKGNLFFAFFYNGLAIPLAAGVFVPLCGWELHSMVASVVMSLSSISVVGNALRLRSVRLS